MSFDNYRTQVLLLHSEQSTLDTLSAGFNDRFTVHCATSGTEALHTLGETPIHVIVSAQQLPGMSGAEALREAKKRSPETIGILLAGQNDKDVEALVGDKEVFQIVRGGISTDELGAVIDNATQRMRLLALAESANDTRALPDETGEHIVMETAENGAAMVSAAPEPQPAAASSSASPVQGTHAVGVLVLSKDEEFIATIRESTGGTHTVHGAETLAAAEETIGKEKIGVVVVDAGLVGSRVEKLTSHLRQVSTRLVSIVAGRRDDGEMLMGLINRGKVYRFLLKPVSPGRARLAIEASVKHHLEAPDSAFKAADAEAAAAPEPAQDVKKAPTAPAKLPRPPQPAVPPPSPKAASADKSTAAKKQAVNQPVLPADLEVDVNFDKLGEAFDAGDSSLKQTVTGLVSTVSKTVAGKSRKSTKPSPAPATLVGKAQEGLGSAIAERKWAGLAAVAVLLLVAGGSYLTSGGDDSAVPGTETAATGSAADAAAPEAARAVSRGSGAPVDELVSRARLLREVGRIYAPVGNNAIEMYTKAAAADPRDEEIADEFAEVVTETLTLGEEAMLEGRVGDAALAISQVEAADPQNPRLPFLSGQIRQMQLRDYLATARAAILDSRFQDAADSISAARGLNPSDRSDIDAVQAELDTARSAERVDDVLAKAAARLDAGRLVSPANDNARYYYELALANDPGNGSAEAGLKMIISSLVLEARADIDAGRFDAAGRLLTDARRIDSRSAEVVAASRALDDARDKRAETERLEQERSAAAEREAEAERLAAEQRRQQEAQAAATAAASADAASADKPGSGDAQAVADTSAPVSSDIAAGDAEQAAGAPVPVSSLTRTKYVAPRYPRSAERRGISGWVDVVFTVGIDGSVSDVEVRASEPGDVFVSSALKAVEKWEFEPVIENERYVEKRAGVRMMFAMQ